MMQARSQPYGSGRAAYYPGGASKFDSFNLSRNKNSV